MSTRSPMRAKATEAEGVLTGQGRSAMTVIDAAGQAAGQQNVTHHLICAASVEYKRDHHPSHGDEARDSAERLERAKGGNRLMSRARPLHLTVNGEERHSRSRGPDITGPFHSRGAGR